MHPTTKLSCFVIILKIIVCNGGRVNIYDVRDSNGQPHLAIQIGDKADFQRSALRGKNYFETFIMAMLNLLSGPYSGRMLQRYMRIVYREVDKLEFTYTRSLAKEFREMSKMSRDEIKSQLRGYKEELQRKPPRLAEFMSIMDSAFTMEQAIRFRDYVLDVKDYGELLKRDVSEETRNILRIIVNRVLTFDIKEQASLVKVMRKAVKEHNLSEPNIYALLFEEHKKQKNNIQVIRSQL